MKAASLSVYTPGGSTFMLVNFFFKSKQFITIINIISNIPNTLCQANLKVILMEGWRGRLVSKDYPYFILLAVSQLLIHNHTRHIDILPGHYVAGIQFATGTRNIQSTSIIRGWMLNKSHLNRYGKSVIEHVSPSFRSCFV